MSQQGEHKIAECCGRHVTEDNLYSCTCCWQLWCEDCMMEGDDSFCWECSSHLHQEITKEDGRCPCVLPPTIRHANKGVPANRIGEKKPSNVTINIFK